MNKKPLVVMGNFWHPVIECVQEVERGTRPGGVSTVGRLFHRALSASDAAAYLAERLPAL